MFKRVFRGTGALLLVLGVLSSGSASAQSLGVGSPAPALNVKEFVKGKPVKSFEKGKSYVVEFWATWCGPCRVSIPHLTGLQKKYPRVTFIGVSVWEQDQAAVRPFVQQMGSQMEYRVALDAVPAGGDGNAGAMAKGWMQAAGQSGIPAAFIVDGRGRIAWIGHPMEMDGPLAAIAAGKWDLQAAAAEYRRKEAQKARLTALQEKLQAAQQSGDPRRLLAVVEEAIQEDPELEAMLGLHKFDLMRTVVRDPAGAQEYGRRLLEVVLKENPRALNALAWSIVDPEAPKPGAGFVALAQAAATRADELAERKDASIADTLARVYFVTGDARKALETQERAVRLAKGTPLAQDRGLQERLEEYRKAAGQ